LSRDGCRAKVTATTGRFAVSATERKAIMAEPVTLEIFSDYV